MHKELIVASKDFRRQFPWIHHLGVPAFHCSILKSPATGRDIYNNFQGEALVPDILRFLLDHIEGGVQLLHEAGYANLFLTHSTSGPMTVEVVNEFSSWRITFREIDNDFMWYPNRRVFTPLQS
jgi:hypothetical protein